MVQLILQLNFCAGRVFDFLVRFWKFQNWYLRKGLRWPTHLLYSFLPKVMSQIITFGHNRTAQTLDEKVNSCVSYYLSYSVHFKTSFKMKARMLHPVQNKSIFQNTCCISHDHTAIVLGIKYNWMFKRFWLCYMNIEQRLFVPFSLSSSGYSLSIKQQCVLERNQFTKYHCDDLSIKLMNSVWDYELSVCIFTKPQTPFWIWGLVDFSVVSLPPYWTEIPRGRERQVW